MGEMHDQSDAQLLRAYAEHGTEAAFAEIVARHTDLVYSAALRQVYSPDHACDVTQSVFTDLARKAREVSLKLSPNASLVGWLYRGTRFAACDLNRTEIRRTQRERQAMEQVHPTPDSAPDWEQLHPTLDEAMSELDEADRDALLLRYFKNHDLRTVGATLGISDDAAQKRVSRAVERLRELFAKRGVSVGAGGLAVVISANAVQAAPVGLTLTISTAAALTATTLTTTTTVTATKAIAMTTLQKTIVTATIAVLAGAGLYEAHQNSKLNDQVKMLRQQQALSAEQNQQLEAENKAKAAQLVLVNENQNKTNSLNEMLRLRAEIARLRREADELSATAKDATAFQAKVFEAISNTAPVRTFVATSSLSVPWNQTIGLGGWKTPSGKRALVLATVERGGDAQQITIRSRVIEYTETGATELGLAGFNDGQQAKGTLTLDTKQATDLLARVQNSREAALANGMSVITASGRPAQVQVVEVRATPSGEKYALGPILDVIPTVSSDGESVQVVMTAQLNYRIPLPTP